MDKLATEQRIKDKINASTKRSCLPCAPEVFVRHCTEEVVIDGRSPFGGTCFMISPDVSLSEFFTNTGQTLSG